MSIYDLDTPLIKLSGVKSDPDWWRIRNAVEGVQIFGGIGSGKTSGSGRMLALKYLAAGFGGVVLTVKPDEKKLWQDYCTLVDRSDDLIIVEPGGKNFFNFLDYEVSKSEGGAITGNIVQVLKTVIKASEEKTSGKSDDAFWDSALDMLIYNSIDLCKLAFDGKISIERMYKIIQSLPKGDSSQLKEDENFFIQALELAKKNIVGQFEAWKMNQPIETLLKIAESSSNDYIYKDAIPDIRLLEFVVEFFTNGFANLHEKTRSIIEFSFSGFLFRLMREPVFSLFCNSPSTFTPDDSLKGKIILINLPVKTFHKIGRDSQIMFKYIWQRAMEKRNINENDQPVFLWADEAQNFLHEHDADFQATTRSSLVATVYISQNLPNYYANMGGNKFEYKVKSFLGTLATKIFHANADIETNNYASEIIGESFFDEYSKSSAMSKEFSSSQTVSKHLRKNVRAEFFASLLTGSKINNHVVEAYMHIQGSPLKNGWNHLKIQFSQSYIPKPLNVKS